MDTQHDSAHNFRAICTNFSLSQKGILLIAEVIFCLVILVCLTYSAVQYSPLSGIEMNLAIFFFAMYSTGLYTNVQCINWPWCDFFRSSIAAILYLITSIYVLNEKGNGSKITGGVLGIIAICLFGYDAYITFPLRQQ